MIRPRRAAPTATGRSEAFSDGVFAVAITLLALDLGRIHGDPTRGDGTLGAAFGEQWPTLLAFAASFVFIGVAWTNHHHVFIRVERLSRQLNAVNLTLLAGIAMVPWATSTLAEALSLPGHHGQQEVLLYGAVISFGTFTWWLLFHTLVTHPELLEQRDHAHGFRADRIGTFVGFFGSAVPAVIGYFWSPIIATVMFFALPVFFAIGSEGFERGTRPSDPGSMTVATGASEPERA